MCVLSLCEIEHPSLASDDVAQIHVLGEPTQLHKHLLLYYKFRIVFQANEYIFLLRQGAARHGREYGRRTATLHAPESRDLVRARLMGQMRAGSLASLPNRADAS
jgi:hypothetical protein